MPDQAVWKLDAKTGALIWTFKFDSGNSEALETVAFAPDGSLYVGGFVGGERDGLGTLYLPDGRVATLRFSSGVPVGDGILWDADLTSRTAVRLWAGDPVSGLLDASEMNESDDRAELAARKKAYMKKEEKAAGGKAMGVEATDRIDIGAAKKIAMGMGMAP